MDQFIIKPNTKVAICSFVSKRYLRTDSNKKVSCQSCHPFMLQSIDEKNHCSFTLVPAEDSNNSQNELNFCSNVYLMSQDGSYLTSNPNGDVFLENTDTKSGHVPEVDKTSMKFRKWVLSNRNNLISKKVVVTTDEVLIKSSFGNYLKFESNQVLANSSVVEDKTSFHFHQVEYLPLPDWAILRPFQSNLYLSSDCSKLFINNELFFLQSAYTGSKPKQELNFDSIASAENAVIEETMYSLMSVDGYFIKRKYREDSSSFYVFENNKDFDLSFVQMVNRILPLAALHDKVKLFEELRGGMNKGLISQAFCNALAQIRAEFYSVLNIVENELANRQLDLQKFWFYLQTSFKIFQTLDSLLATIQNDPKTPILTVLYVYLSTAIDE